MRDTFESVELGRSVSRKTYRTQEEVLRVGLPDDRSIAIAGRLRTALLRESIALVESGTATPSAVDTLVRTTIGRRLAVGGPFEIWEQIGWDLVQVIAGELLKDISNEADIPSSFESLFGHTGGGPSSRVLTQDQSTAGAIYVEWTRLADSRAQDDATPSAERRTLIEEALEQTVAALTEDWGADWAEWRYGRGNPSALAHMFIPNFDLPAVERPGGFGTINATGANFRRIIDLSDLDNSVATNAPGQSAQPGSPFYGNLTDYLGNGEYFPFLFTREAVEKVVAHRLTLQPGG